LSVQSPSLASGTRPRALANAGPVALLLAAVATATGCVLTADLELDGLGLVRSLHPLYLVALALLPLATLLESRRPSPRTWMLGAPVLAFVLVVWLTPLILEGTPRFRTSYQSWSYVDPLLSGHGLLPAKFIYHNWPLFPGLFAALQWVSGIGDTTIIAAFPLAVMLSWLALVVALVRILAPQSGPVGWALAAWTTAAFSWTNQDYFSPQALAFVLFLALLVVLARAAGQQHGVLAPRTVLIAVALYAGIVATHALTSMIALAVILSLTVTRCLRRPGIVLIFALMFVIWQANVADSFYSAYGPRLRDTLLSAGDFLQVNAASRVSGSAEHLTVVRVRIAMSLAAFALAVAAVLLTRSRRNEPAWRFAVVYLGALALVTPVSSYGGEMLIRALLFALPAIAALVAITQPRGPVLAALIALLVIAAPVHIVAHYGNEAYDYVSEDEIEGFRFVAERLAPARLYGGYPAGAFLRSADMQFRNGVTPNATRPPRADAFLHLEAQHWGRPPIATYLALGRGDDAAATLFANHPDFVEHVRSAIERRPAEFIPVFENHDITIWRHLAPRGAP